MSSASEQRRSPRLFVNLPVTYEVIPSKELEMPKDLAEVYERVHPSSELAGTRIEGVIRDLSINGAFINGSTVPLLSRVMLVFPLPGMPEVEGIGWVLWRRKRECVIQRVMPGDKSPSRLILPEGFGVLFESITSGSRRHIDRLIRMNDASRAIISAV
ncbi:MAG: PilZ domain-containing protein [bacterium]